MDKINKIAAKYDLYVVEDACQALGSTKYGCKLGTQSDVGVFSLSVTKIISSGQGGFAVTHDKAIAELLRDIRTHGVETVVNPTQWSHPGFNFRITDVQASIALEQLNKISSHIDNVTKIYLMYLDGVANNDLVKAIEVDLEGGEVPVYNEFLVKSLDVFSNYLSDRGIESRGFYPSVNSAGYLQQTGDVFPNSHMYEKEGIYLPSGPSQDFCDIKYVVDTLNDYG